MSRKCWPTIPIGETPSLPAILPGSSSLPQWAHSEPPAVGQPVLAAMAEAAEAAVAAVEAAEAMAVAEAEVAVTAAHPGTNRFGT